MGIYMILYLISLPKSLWHFHNKESLVVRDILAMGERNWGKGTWPRLSEVHGPRHGERDCTMGAELPDLPPRHTPAGPVQLPEYTAGAAGLPQKLQSFGGSPAEKGIVQPELSCRARAEFTPPDLLVRWSTKS